MLHLLVLVGILLILVCPYIAVAASTGLNTGQNSQNQPTNNTNFKQNDEGIQTRLKNFADSSHHLQQTIHEIIFEITRQEYAMASGPNVVGPMVIPAVPPTSGMIPIGEFFPPREKYMKHYAQETHDLLVMLSEESLSLPGSVENDSDLSADLVSIKKYLDDLKTEDDNLQALMAGPAYSNLLIGKQALQMSDELDQMKKLLKESEKHIHKDIKEEK